MAFEQNLYKNRANKKSIIIAIFDLITIDKDNYIGNHDKPSLQNQLMRVLIDILQQPPRKPTSFKSGMRGFLKK